MTDNPLGALGMRSLLRLLSRKENALKHFQSDGCHLARNMPVQGCSELGAVALRFAGGTNVNHWY